MKLTADGPSLEQIIAWAQQRAQNQGAAVDAMRKIQSTYDGELVIPLPEMDRMEDPAVANIIAEGIDQLAGRIASTTPNIYYPPVDPGAPRSEMRARTRIRASQGWLQFNKYGNRQRRRAAQLIAYGFSPYSVTFSAKWGAPEWQYRDPLNTFPLVTNDPDEMQPPNVIYKFQRSYGYLKVKYPDEMAGVETGHEPADSAQFDLIEYNDDQVTVLAVLGVKTQNYTQSDKGAYAELLRSPNRAGICLGVMAGRIGLSRTRGQFDGAVGIYKAQARMTALQIIAIEKGIFPAVVLTSHPGQQARLLSPAMHDGRTGIPNTVVNGEMSYLEIPQSQAAQTLGHDLEHAIRVTSGIPADVGGESQSNVRTGKRGDSIVSAVIDIPIQAAQEMLAESLHEELRRGIALIKAYGPNRKVSLYVGRDKNPTVYTPSVEFENDNCTVSYAMAGADANGLIVALAQRVGAGTMSKHTAMEIDPMIDDVLLEQELIDVENLVGNLQAALDQQAQAGTITPNDMASIIKLRMANVPLVDAVIKVHEQAQARQATLAPAAGDGQAVAPETQPGLAIPGQGAEQPSIQPPSQSAVNLSSLLRTNAKPAQLAASAAGRPELGG